MIFTGCVLALSIGVGCSDDDEGPSSTCELLEQCCGLFSEEEMIAQATCESFLPDDMVRDEEAESAVQMDCELALGGFINDGVCASIELPPEAEDDDNTDDDDQATGGGDEMEEESPEDS